MEGHDPQTAGPGQVTARTIALIVAVSRSLPSYQRPRARPTRTTTTTACGAAVIPSTVMEIHRARMPMAEVSVARGRP